MLWYVEPNLTFICIVQQWNNNQYCLISKLVPVICLFSNQSKSRINYFFLREKRSKQIIHLVDFVLVWLVCIFEQMVENVKNKARNVPPHSHHAFETADKHVQCCLIR